MVLLPKRLCYKFQGLWCLFYILWKKNRFGVQIDSKEGYLTLWCHLPYPRSIFESSNSGRIRMPRGVRWDKKSFGFGDLKTQLQAGFVGHVWNLNLVHSQFLTSVVQRHLLCFCIQTCCRRCTKCSWSNSQTLVVDRVQFLWKVFWSCHIHNTTNNHSPV